MPCEAMRAVTRLDLLKEYIKCVRVASERRLFGMPRNKYLLTIGRDHGLGNHNGGGAATRGDRAESVRVGRRAGEGHSHDLEDTSQRVY